MAIQPPFSPITTRSRPGALVLIVLLHGLLGAGVLLYSPVLELATASTPLQVLLLTPAQPPEPPAPAPRPAPLPPPPQQVFVAVPEVNVAPPPPEPNVTATPAPAKPNVVVAAAIETLTPPAPPAPPPAPVAPVVLPPSAIQYLALPEVVYPAASRRLNETGLVVVAVWVGTDGLPQQVQLAQSSGFERLDRAALEGVRRARFKPYVLNGRATAGWARIPIPFELTS